MKYVIIGGVAGGATAAARLRRVDEMAEILLLEKGPYISYANCGLPYYIGGVIAEREKLLVQTPASFGKRFRIDVRVENEVIAIDPEKKHIPTPSYKYISLWPRHSRYSAKHISKVLPLSQPNEFFYLPHLKICPSYPYKQESIQNLPKFVAIYFVWPYLHLFLSQP